jgi:hypothetical protein
MGVKPGKINRRSPSRGRRLCWWRLAVGLPESSWTPGTSPWPTLGSRSTVWSGLDGDGVLNPEGRAARCFTVCSVFIGPTPRKCLRLPGRSLVLKKLKIIFLSLSNSKIIFASSKKSKNKSERNQWCNLQACKNLVWVFLNCGLHKNN